MATSAAGAAAAAENVIESIPDSNNSPIFVDTQHDDMVHDAQLDYYGCKLATSSSDRTVKIYDVSNATYSHTATLLGHEGPVWQVSWAHPKFGIILASASFDGSVILHQEIRPNNNEWSTLHAFRNLHESSVNGVAFAPHEFGLVAAAASSDGRVSILTHREDNTWDVEYIADNALGVNAVSWAPYVGMSSDRGRDSGGTNDERDDSSAQQQQQQHQQRRLSQPRLVTGGCDNRIRFWTRNYTTGKWEEEPSSQSTTTDPTVSHSDWVRDVAWAPSIIPDVSVVASCSEDRTVIIWTQSEKDGPWNPTLLHTFDAPVWRVSWSVTGNILAVSSGDSDVTLWKAGLDGVWSQVGTVEDVAGGGGGGSGAGGQQQTQPAQQ